MWGSGYAVTTKEMKLCDALIPLEDMSDYVNKMHTLQWDKKLSIYVLRNYTIENLKLCVEYYAYKQGIQTEMYFSDYDGYVRDIIENNPRMSAESIQIIFFTLVLDNIPWVVTQEGLLDEKRIMQYMEELITKIKKVSSAVIAVTNFLPPVHNIYMTKVTADFDYSLRNLNQSLRKMALEDNRLVLVDYERYLQTRGYDDSIDLRYWFMFKAPLSQLFLQDIGKEIAHIMGNIKGNIKKIVVLDCDNTLWGGIIGEDGIEGIRLSRNEYPGNIFFAFQQQLKLLSKRGVLLALCSKNNEQDVIEVLEKHPDCLIKQEYLAAWRINWNDKVTNLKQISDELNIGLESFIFIDDSKAEIDLVASMLPMVETILVPQRIYEITNILKKCQNFSCLYSTEEEKDLIRRYVEQRQRKIEEVRFNTFEEYIESLKLEIEIGVADQKELARVSQLTLKTNQFNLITKRYSFGEIERISMNHDYLILVLKVKDRFGDYGLTGVSILRNSNKEIQICDLLLSCRVLGKKIEDTFLNSIIHLGKQKFGADYFTAQYAKTNKNEQVKNFYEKHGFVCVHEEENKKLYQANFEDIVWKEEKFFRVHIR